ncbi:hypothetical protein TNIN_493811 [Trichonephila inaurata madagascariensis]|uniref:Uncharacterized protein n=1 Tax=Trichonephila inaurata madagascariensis TaxID=2747483 RepID=A0A8X6YYS2_9ARAC|nr:hypothetical protein TNIN_493811 [Trichonephila inaurata madagascariensis]
MPHRVILQMTKENNMLDNPNNANLEIPPNNPFYERVSQIPLNASSENCTDEAVKENNMPHNPNNSNLEILPSNPFYERESYDKDYHFIPIP